MGLIGRLFRRNRNSQLENPNFRRVSLNPIHEEDAFNQSSGDRIPEIDYKRGLLEEVSKKGTKEVPRHVIHGVFQVAPISVYDADTCWSAAVFKDRDGGDVVERFATRILGMDAPEVRGVSRPFGLEVRNVVRHLIKNKICLIHVPRTNHPDPYGRNLAHLYAYPGDEDNTVPFRVRGRQINVPVTSNIPAGYHVSPENIEGYVANGDLIDICKFLLDNKLVKPYDGDGPRPKWTAEELEKGLYEVKKS